VLTGDDIDYGITAADLVSDHISLRADETAEEFHIEAQGDTDDVDLTFTNDDLLAGSVDEAAESLFSLDYLQRHEPRDGHRRRGVAAARLRDASQTALLSTQRLLVKVVYMLAPRIQSE